MKLDFMNDENLNRPLTLTEDQVEFLVHGDHRIHRSSGRGHTEELDEILKSRSEHFGCDLFGKSHRARFSCGEDY